MKMRTLIFVLFLILGSAGAAVAQANTGPGDTSKAFYKWYLHELNAERSPTDEKAKMRSFISARLNKWINSKAYEEYDTDYFIDAQDYGKAWENNIQISKVVVTGNAATLRVALVDHGSMGTQILDLKLLKEGGAWKIDRITSRH